MPNDQSDHITQAITSVMRRTQRSLSPWVQRSLQTDAPAPSIARRPMTLATATTASLLNRVQRMAGRSSALRFDRVTNGAASLDHFAERVIDHFPPIAAKYEPRPMESTPPVQRSPLPLPEQAAPEFSPEIEPTESLAPGPFAPTSSVPQVQRAPVAVSEDIDRSTLPSVTSALRQARAQAPRKPETSTSTSTSRPASTIVRPTDQPKVRRAQITEVAPRQEAAVSERPAESITHTDQPSSSSLETTADQSPRPSPRQLARTIGQLRPFIQRTAAEESSAEEPPPSQAERLRRFTETVQREAQDFATRLTQPETPAAPQPTRSTEPSARVVRRKIEEIMPAAEQPLPLRSRPIEPPETPPPIEAAESSIPVIQRAGDETGKQIAPSDNLVPEEPPIGRRVVDATRTPRVTDQPNTIEPAAPETIQRTSEPAIEAAPSIAPTPAPTENLSTDLPLRRAVATEPHEETIEPGVPAISQTSAATIQRAVEPTDMDLPLHRRGRLEPRAAEAEAASQPQPVRSSAAGAPREAAAVEAAVQPEMPSPSTPMVQRAIEPAGAMRADESRAADATAAISSSPPIIQREEESASIDEVMPLRMPPAGETVQRSEESLPSDQPTEQPAFDLGRRVLARTQLPVSQKPPSSSAPVVQHQVDRSESLSSEQAAPQTTPVAGSGLAALPSAPVESAGTAEGSKPTASWPSITQILRRKIAEAATAKASTSTTEVESARTEPITSTPIVPPARVQANLDESETSSDESPPIPRAEVSTPAIPITGRRALSDMPLVSRIMRTPLGAEERSEAEKPSDVPPTPARAPLPLPPIKASTSSPKIQRAPESISISPAPQQVQRAEGDQLAASQPPAAPAIDLDELAREVYPLLKRLIAVERERRG